MYFFKPVSHSPFSRNHAPQLKATPRKAIEHRQYNVFGCRCLHSRNVNGARYTSLRMVPLSESSTHFHLLKSWLSQSVVLKGPFNKKESTFAVIMASAASNAAMATEVLAVQGKYYKMVPPKLATMFIVSGSQYFGYCIAGLMKRELNISCDNVPLDIAFG